MIDKTFLDTYNETIAPKLMELDVFLKAKETPFTIWEASQLLDISYHEAQEIVKHYHVDALNDVTIFQLILHGGSRLCRLIRHEKERGFPSAYTPEDIAFIYELDQQLVQSACQRIGLSQIGKESLTQLFRLLPYVAA